MKFLVFYQEESNVLYEFVGSFNSPTYTSDRLEYMQYLYCNVSLQGEKMYLKGLKALENGLIVLDPGVEFLFIDNLATVVSILCSKNELSYDMCIKAKKIANTNTVPTCYRVLSGTKHH